MSECGGGTKEKNGYKEKRIYFSISGKFSSKMTHQKNKCQQCFITVSCVEILRGTYTAFFVVVFLQYLAMTKHKFFIVFVEN